ncbi:MAG TPA: hypothetical protein VFJ19_01510 [Nocardioidaceae bacterium]|nr:hypothetical protein [Nocardioidaceae bacterium]
MHILLWLVPPVAVTAIAMVWAAWAGRGLDKLDERERRDRRDTSDRRTDADQERLARALAKPHPGAGRTAPAAPRDRSTGIAVRPSRSAAQGQSTRRTA